MSSYGLTEKAMKMAILRNLLCLCLLCLVLGSLAPAQAQTAPSPQAPANQGNQPNKPGPAQKTAAEPVKSAAGAQPWARIPVPPLPAFHPPLPKRLELPNGMVVFLQEDHELPLISLTARIRGGAVQEPADKAGLSTLYGEVWRTGGTKDKSGDQMDDFLEARAARIETEGGPDSTTISLNCLKDDFNAVFGLLRELLTTPAFREEKLALAKQQLNTRISRRNDELSSIATREARRLAYGKDNPYARYPEYYTVAAVTQEDLQQWHARFVHPNNILLGVVGDFDAGRMEAVLREAFGTWPKGPAVTRPNLQFVTAPAGLYYASKEDVDQSLVRMVALGIRRDNPDFYAVSVMNEVFGGSMSSRLFKSIRTKQGLAYAVGGSLGAAYDHPGIFALGVGPRTEKTAQAIKALNEEIEGLLKEPATATELHLAKDAILNSFIFSVDTPEKVLGERMTYEFYGYPLDSLERFRQGVEKVTIADVNRAVHTYVKPGTFAVLVVGNAEAEKLLGALGPVKTLDISIPAETREEKAATGR